MDELIDLQQLKIDVRKMSGVDLSTELQLQSMAAIAAMFTGDYEKSKNFSQAAQIAKAELKKRDGEMQT